MNEKILTNEEQELVTGGAVADTQIPVLAEDLALAEKEELANSVGCTMKTKFIRAAQNVAAECMGPKRVH